MKLCCHLLVHRSVSLLSATGSTDTSTDYSLHRVYSSFFISKSVCVYSLSTGRTPPDRWWRGRCSPAWRRARWRKWQRCSSPLQLDPLNQANDVRQFNTEMSAKVCVCPTSEQFKVVHTGYCYLLLFLFLFFFLFTPDHRQFVEFQGNYIVVIYQTEPRTDIQKTTLWRSLRHWRACLPERSPVKAVAPK